MNRRAHEWEIFCLPFERELGRRKEAGLLGRAGPESGSRPDGRPLPSIIVSVINVVYRPRSAGRILAETGWKTLFWLNCCERKILFRLKKEVEQAEYGVSRTGRITWFWRFNFYMHMFYFRPSVWPCLWKMYWHLLEHQICMTKFSMKYGKISWPLPNRILS